MKGLVYMKKLLLVMALALIFLFPAHSFSEVASFNVTVDKILVPLTGPAAQGATFTAEGQEGGATFKSPIARTNHAVIVSFLTDGIFKGSKKDLEGNPISGEVETLPPATFSAMITADQVENGSLPSGSDVAALTSWAPSASGDINLELTATTTLPDVKKTAGTYELTITYTFFSK